MAIDETKAEEIREWFRKDPSRMTMVAARHFEVAEGDVVNALTNEWPIVELRSENFREIMEGLQKVGLVRIFVRSKAAVMECDGNLSEAKFSNTGPFFNIDGGGIDMHIMHKDITRVFTMEKKSHMNPEDNTYSVQFFDGNGDSAFKMFLWESFPKTPEASIKAFRELIEKYAVKEAAASA